MENKKSKRVVQFEIDEDVKKLTIEGIDNDQQVVMREEIGEDELEQASGGWGNMRRYYEDESMHHDEPTLILRFGGGFP